MLANKYRPQRFSEFVGQDVVINLIRRSIMQRKIGQSLLLSGMHGVGKTSLARVIAKSLNCTQRDSQAEPCNGCQNCKLILAGCHPDISEIDAASHTSVDNMRQIISNSKYLSMQAQYKINIIDEAHMLSDSAFNSLLKTLEEPSENVIFILATTKPEKIPETIISRCQRYFLDRFNADTINEQLTKLLEQEGVKCDSEAIANIAQAAKGSLRDALLFLEQALYFDRDHISSANVNNMLNMQHDQKVLQLLLQIMHGEKVQAIGTMQCLNASYQPQNIIHSLLKIIHQVIISLHTGARDLKPALGDSVDAAALKSMVDGMDVLCAHRLWCIAWKYLRNLDYRLLAQEMLEVMVIEMMYSLHMDSAPHLAQNILRNLHHADSRDVVREGASAERTGTKNVEKSVEKQSGAHGSTSKHKCDKLSESYADSVHRYDKLTKSKELKEISQDFPQVVIEVHKRDK